MAPVTETNNSDVSDVSRRHVTSVNVPPGLWGGYSEYVYLDPQALIHRIADHVPTECAPFYVPLSNGIRWTHLEGGIGIGDTVVILGPGGQGLACVIAAREAGAGKIIITGRARDANRLALAREFGAHHTIDVDAEKDVATCPMSTWPTMSRTLMEVAAPMSLHFAVTVAVVASRLKRPTAKLPSTYFAYQTCWFVAVETGFAATPA